MRVARVAPRLEPLVIQQRQLLQCTTTQALFRVVFISQSHTWLMPTDLKSKAWPHSVLSIDLHANVDEGRFVACKDGASVTPSVKASDHAQKTYDLFRGALDNTFALLTSNGRRDALAALQIAGKSATKKAFYKVVRRWLIGGCVVPALCATWVGTSPKLSTDGVPQMSYEGAVTQVPRVRHLRHASD